MPNIAVVLSEWSPTCPGVLGGIIDFAQSTADWNVQHFQCNDHDVENAIAAWQADGILYCADKSPRSTFASPVAKSVPLVTIGTAHAPFPAVIADPTSLANLALEHLDHHLLERVAFVTRAGPSSRNDGSLESDFDPVAKAADAILLQTLSSQLGDRLEHLAVDVAQHELISVGPPMNPTLQGWLAGAKSCGVIASCDRLAAYVVRLTKQLQKSIPADISVIALRDSYICGLPMISVSAVVEPCCELGFQSARLLHRLLAGYPAPFQPLQIAADKVINRLTTVAPTLSQAISRALRFIEENATRGISVSDVMAFQQTSRVTFERNFREAIGCPPGEQIRKVRMAHAERLLTTTDFSVAEVGKLCGFDTIAKFSTFFKNASGVSPLKYRQQRRSNTNGEQVIPKLEESNG